MTERCGKLYNGNYRCGWFVGHSGDCGPWNVEEPQRSLSATRIARDESAAQKSEVASISPAPEAERAET